MCIINETEYFLKNLQLKAFIKILHLIGPWNFMWVIIRYFSYSPPSLSLGNNLQTTQV